MSRNWFLAIMGNLHFIDSLARHTRNQEQPRAIKGPMEMIRPIFEYLKMKFAATFKPNQKLIIDESLLLWRTNTSIRQYMPSKRHHYGLKSFVKCDCRIGYIQDIILYMGKKTELVESRTYRISGAVVITMMQDYLDRGHILYLDNCYSSPSLTKYLQAALQESVAPSGGI